MCSISVAIYFCVVAALFAQNPNDPPPVLPPPTSVNVILLERDYNMLTRAFNLANKSNGLQDGADKGLWVVRIPDYLAQRLTLTLFNSLQGTRAYVESAKTKAAKHKNFYP